MPLIWSSSFAATGSRLKCSKNLLFTVFHIDPSILYIDMRSSVTLPSRADSSVSTPVVFARSTRTVSPCFSTWTTFRTAPDGANSCPSVSWAYGVTRLHFGKWYLMLWARILGFFWCCQALSNYLMMKLMCNIPGACKRPQAHLPLKWFHEYHQIGQDLSRVFLLLLVNSFTFLGW